MRCHVVGSGPVGLAFALFARRAGLDREQVLLDGARVRALAAGQASGPRRQLAISEGSRQLLSRVIPFPPAATIESIEVELAGRAGRTRIRARDFGLPVLGHVLSWDALATALARATLDAVAVPDVDDDTKSGVGASDLEVHAEGVIDEGLADTLPFGQSALLAEVRHDGRAPTATAFERFDRHGPLALLPLGTDGDRFSLVWCDEDTRTAQRARLGAEAVAKELAQRFGDRLGRLTIDGDLVVAPLNRIRRRDAARNAAGTRPAVWIGNASQTLHPVAGQGLNLGLRDAFELAQQLGELNEQRLLRRRSMSTSGSTHEELDHGLQRMIRKFEQSRRFDRRMLVGVTDALALGFGSNRLHGLQSALLMALDVAPPLRRPLAATLLYGQRR